MSRRFVLEPAAKALGDVSLLRDAWLAPGTYKLEAVAYEAGRRAGVTTDRVPWAKARSADRPCPGGDRARGPPAGPGSADLETGHPLRFGDVVLQPSAGEPLAKQGNGPWSSRSRRLRSPEPSRPRLPPRSGATTRSCPAPSSSGGRSRPEAAAAHRRSASGCFARRSLRASGHPHRRDGDPHHRYPLRGFGVALPLVS